MKRSYDFGAVQPEQLPFIFAGKRYLFARFLGQAVLVVAFLFRVRRGEPWMSGMVLLEEQLLARTYPDYQSFAATRKRLAPGIW